MLFPTECPVCKQKAISYETDYIFCTNCPLFRKRLTLFQNAYVWASHKTWWWRAAIFIWFITLLASNLWSPEYSLNRLANIFSTFDLGIHELGHVLFSPIGEFMHILGGSLLQCIFPLLWLIGFLQKRWYFAASLCLCWLGLNLFDVATYVADARARLLPLTAGLGYFGIDPTENDAAYDSAHDWYQLLSRTNHLNSDLAIAQGLRIAATISFIVGLSFAAALLLRMITSSYHKRSERQQGSDTIL